jgi:hypothetical protein
MDRRQLVQQLDAEIRRLTEARNLLADDSGRGGRTARQKRGVRHMSREARENIAAAQRKRWAARKAGQNSASTGRPTSAAGRRGPRRMSREGRARIAAAQKARWAAIKAKKTSQKKS